MLKNQAKDPVLKSKAYNNYSYNHRNLLDPETFCDYEDERMPSAKLADSKHIFATSDKEKNRDILVCEKKTVKFKIAQMNYFYRTCKAC